MENIDNQWLQDLLKDLKTKGEIQNDTHFCKKTGINKSFLSSMKSGKDKISEQTVVRIKEAFPVYFGMERMEKEELCKLCAEKDRIIAAKDELIISLNKQIALLEKSLSYYEGKTSNKKAG